MDLFAYIFCCYSIQRCNLELEGAAVGYDHDYIDWAANKDTRAFG